MSKSQHAATRQAAQAMRNMAKRVGQNEQGADWRLGRVSAVHTGTVEIEDAPGVRIRRLATYTSHAVGDVIAVTVSGVGNWLALGKLAAGA